MIQVARPDPAEYSGYFGPYIESVSAEDAMTALREQGARTQALLAGLDESRGAYRYAPGKWSIKEVVGHLLDTERVFGYRALRFARGDATPLPGFDHDRYVVEGRFDEIPLDALREQMQSVRAATLALFGSFGAEELRRRGVANGNTMSVRALAYVLAGHEQHHRAVLEERYL